MPEGGLHGGTDRFGSHRCPKLVTHSVPVRCRKLVEWGVFG